MYEALLELRNTPRKDTDKSPHEMMFNRSARTIIPGTIPKESMKRRLRKENVKRSYHKSARQLQKMGKGQNIYFERRNRQWSPGRVI